MFKLIFATAVCVPLDGQWAKRVLHLNRRRRRG